MLPQRNRAKRWEQWASSHLQDGDLLFVQGESRILLGLVDFSKLCTELADSQFSHIALVAREQGQWVVYDTVLTGPRRTPFGQFMADRRVWKVAVKRLRPEYRARVPQAIAYCRQVVETGIAFDDDFRLNNDRLYCSELIEVAFRHGGIALSEPIAINRLPGFDRVAKTTLRVVEAATSIEPEQKVIVPGNDRFGIWACPYLELVLPITDASSPPESSGSRPGRPPTSQARKDAPVGTAT